MHEPNCTNLKQYWKEIYQNFELLFWGSEIMGYLNFHLNIFLNIPSFLELICITFIIRKKKSYKRNKMGRIHSQDCEGCVASVAGAGEQ